MWGSVFWSHKFLKCVEHKKKNLMVIPFLKVVREMALIFKILFLKLFVIHLLLSTMRKKHIFIDSEEHWEVS